MTVPAAFSRMTTPGQVPSRERLVMLRRLEQMPRAPNEASLARYDEPILRVSAITKGLGLDPARESAWNRFLDEQINGGINELVLRKALFERMHEERMDPERRSAIFQRSMNYYRDRLSKSRVQILTPEEVLQKAEARGGTYHRRVPAPGGKGFRYYYDEEKYGQREDAHVSGAEAKKARIQKAIHSLLETKKSCSVDEMKALAKKFGASDVAAVLKSKCAETGPWQFAKGKFALRQQAPMTKSVTPQFYIVEK